MASPPPVDWKTAVACVIDRGRGMASPLQALPGRIRIAGRGRAPKRTLHGGASLMVSAPWKTLSLFLKGVGVTSGSHQMQLISLRAVD